LRLAQGGERHDWQSQAAIADAKGLGILGMPLNRGGEAVQTLDQEEIALAVRATDEPLHNRIARAQPGIERR
jgi:hypothetical protein